MATTRFASMPNVSMPRTKMGVSFTHPTSFTHGKVFPIFNAFVMPGDSFKLDIAALIRMSTPIAPLFGNIEFKVHSFFVPMRLVWEHTEEFFGENKTSAGPQETQYLIPAASYGIDDHHTSIVEGLSHYLGKPLANHEESPLVYIDADIAPKVSVLQERAYWLIINEYYRRQQVEAPILIDTSDDPFIRLDDRHESGGVLVVDKLFDRDCFTTSKKDDYFTSATLAPQYSADPVMLPLGEYAPVAFAFDDEDNPINMNSGSFMLDSNKNVIGFDKEGYQDYVSFGVGHLAGEYGVLGNANGDAALYAGLGEDLPGTVSNISDSNFQTNLVANLSAATAASVNEIRLAFATQRFLERDNFGTRYPEIIKSHFGVTSSLAILQRPQLLYKASTWINIQQVLSTAGYESGTTTKVGQPGANSVTAFKAPIVHNAFDEFGFILILCETKFNRLYSQGLNKFDLKRTKFDFYFPEFATIGDQAITIAEIFAQADTNDVNLNYDDIFGYQEAWAEYRYFPDRVSGKLDPQSNAGFSFWTLADNISSDEIYSGINDDWLKEDRNSIIRGLVSGRNGPDYIGDFAITGTMIRTMPLYSIPGLVDHVGGR